ncbi:AbgT family transporter [Alysiella crassa]|uniref:Aminobenzoyl-glutamate transport protein n=1 Tax=Alysiella crassa TaxID=153491 RepID=A0A376BNJ6_9NEIS|nr:AbgT family transporter [Alysiella crassa]SSY71246.1 Aminobenzoyl-glutamate transport protein [Alysiella crassa]
MNHQSDSLKNKRLHKLLNVIEWLGNLLPHPVVLFLIFIGILLLTSAIGAYFDWSVMDPRPEGAKGRAADGMIRVVNLLNGDGIVKMLENLVTNFTGFAPLGTALIALLGVGVAERSGLISAAMRALILNAPKRLITLAVVFAGVMSNVASELGYVVIIPLAGMVFYALGRHPIAGIAAAFAGVSGGYSANLLIGTVDPILSGITQQAARMIAPEYTVGAEANWYFMAFSAIFISLLGWLITEKITEPRLGKYEAEAGTAEAGSLNMHQLTHDEKRGLKAAGVTLLVLTGIVLALLLPENGILRNPKTGSITSSPFMNGIVAFVFIFFSITGIVFGHVAGTMKGSAQIIEGMESSMKSMSLYLVLIFFVSQFVAYFSWSNLGPILAVQGSEFLKNIGLTGGLLMFCFIVICAFINLMIGSASAQWAVTAPIFVPMLMLAGYAPETIQAAYRIGDSVTNIITPLMSFFGLILAVCIRYKKDMGVGSLIAIMLPYSVIFLLFWSFAFYIWVFVLGLPVGPGSPIYYQP